MSSTGLGRAFCAGRPALVLYLVAGYPDRAGSLEAINAAVEAGADLVELGVPYTDQLADGPVIVEASADARRAAGGRFGLTETLELVAEYREAERRAGSSPVPLALMTYLNPLLRRGFAEAAAAMRDAGVDGVIVPDLPPDMAGAWLSQSDGIDTVFLAAPTSTEERLEVVGTSASGFVYCVSTTGITGERSELPPGLGELVERVRAHADLPVAVGFGISTPEQAAAVASVADGVVVGSAAVRRQHDPAALSAFVAALGEAVHGSSDAA